MTVRSAFDPLTSRDRSNCASLKRALYEAMRVRESAVKAGAFIVRLRQREEEFACLGRARIDREVQYFFVKELGAETARRRTHQICCGFDIHPTIMCQKPDR